MPDKDEIPYLLVGLCLTEFNVCKNMNHERHQIHESILAARQPVFVYLVSFVVDKDALFLLSGLRQVTRRNLPGYYDLFVFTDGRPD